MAPAERLSALFGRRRFAVKPGTGRIAALLERLGHPERGLRCVHVVGTNGKGSTAAFLSAILTQAGYRTGLFTSPHLVRFTERFRVDGTEVSDDLLDRMVAAILATAHTDDTFFELTTALACQLFAEQGVQVAVLEAGMGGRADATAAVPALATVVTPISLDHAEWLGATVAAIAAEKIAIAEPGTPVICAPQEDGARSVIVQHCTDNNNRLILAGRDFDAHWRDGGQFLLRNGSDDLDCFSPGIPGGYQLWNAATAIMAARTLAESGLAIPEPAFADGIATARWPGRMERFSLPNGAEVILDGAHNPAGATALADSLVRTYPGRSITLLLGIMADKDIGQLLTALLPLAVRVITVAPLQERAVPADELAQRCTDHGVPAQAGGGVVQGLALAQATAQAGDLVVVAGSLFTVGEARAVLTDTLCEAVRG